MKIKSVSAFWRHTADVLTMGPIDAWVFFPALLCSLHAKVWTGILLAVFVVASMGARWYGYTVPRALLAVRAYLAGKEVSRGLTFGKKRLNCHLDKDGV